MHDEDGQTFSQSGKESVTDSQIVLWNCHIIRMILSSKNQCDEHSFLFLILYRISQVAAAGFERK